MVGRPLHDALLASSRHRQRPEREDQRLQQLASRHEQPECVEGVDEAAQRVRRAAFFGLRRDEHPEQHGLYGVGYQHHGDDAEERDQRQRMERRMPREDQRSESHDDREGREEDGRLVRVEHPAPGFVFAQQAVHDEDAEVVADAEYEGREDDRHDVELDAQPWPSVRG